MLAITRWNRRLHLKMQSAPLAGSEAAFTSLAQQLQHSKTLPAYMYDTKTRTTDKERLLIERSNAVVTATMHKRGCCAALH
jgi:hypothetical protein